MSGTSPSPASTSGTPWSPESATAMTQQTSPLSVSSSQSPPHVGQVGPNSPQSVSSISSCGQQQPQQQLFTVFLPNTNEPAAVVNPPLGVTILPSAIFPSDAAKSHHFVQISSEGNLCPILYDVTQHLQSLKPVFSCSQQQSSITISKTSSVSVVTWTT